MVGLQNKSPSVLYRPVKEGDPPNLSTPPPKKIAALNYFALNYASSFPAKSIYPLPPPKAWNLDKTMKSTKNSGLK